jgi:hypothetical protein
MNGRASSPPLPDAKGKTQGGGKIDEVLKINSRGGSNRADGFRWRFCAKKGKRQSASERGSEDQGNPEASAEQQQ